ncbi:MAG: hypothetical protein E7558_09160 [Ruminococcaceae bacterium]|nr:hypothetical protein [Oscillospiraceae bacterium]
MIEIILLFIAVTLVITILAIYKIKKKKYVTGISMLVIFACVVIYIICKSGVLVHTGAIGSSFTYINHGTNYMDSHSIYYIDDPAVLIEEKELSYGIFTQEISFGHRFRAVQSGECDLIVWEIDCGGFSYADVYHITVDENLKCSYTHQRPETIRDINFWTGTVSVRFNGEEYKPGYNAFKNMICLYGENKECEKPSEDYPVMEVESAISRDDPPETMVQKYYIKDENTVYFALLTYTHDETGKTVKDENGEYVMTPVWYEFTKDPQCKNSLLDVLEKLKQ